jgi:hypothetical protein
LRCSIAQNPQPGRQYKSIWAGVAADAEIAADAEVAADDASGMLMSTICGENYSRRNHRPNLVCR